MKKIYFIVLFTFAKWGAVAQKPVSSTDSIKKAFKAAWQKSLPSVAPTAAETDPFIPNLIPPSPTAASLGKHVDFPVNLYNGMPSLPIPIHTLKSRNISVPIVLNNHASGVKVGEVASWVGISASLDAGGLITRTVKGLPDDDPGAGFFLTRNHYPNPDNISFAGVAENVWKNDVVGSAKGIVDFEQDIYMLNAMGRSYKLLFKSDGTILTIPHSDLKITVDFANDTWEILLEDGTKLSFGGNNATEITDGDANLDVQPFGSTWYLKAITSHQGDVVNFTYTYSLIEQDIAFTESDFIKFFTSGPPFLPTIVNSAGSKISAKIRNIAVLHLSSITSDNETVEFVKSATQREDLTGGYALSQIKIKPKNDTNPTEEYEFKYQFTGVSSSLDYNPSNKPEYNKRLQLDTLFRRVAGKNYQPWVFQYNPLRLPSRRSFAQDHFGYFNGATANSSLLPALHLAIPSSLSGINPADWGFMPNAHVLGGSREPNSEAMQAQTIRSIQYPTGGKTVFRFEPNAVPLVEYPYNADNGSVSLSSAENPNASSIGTFFPNTRPQYVRVVCQGQFSSAYLQDLGDNTPLVDASIFKNFTPPSIWGRSIKKIDLDANNSFYFSTYVNIQELDEYYYRIGTTNPSSNAGDYSFSTTIYFERQSTVPTTQKLVGGLRIAKTTMDDGLGAKATERFFKYDNPLIINPISLSDYLETTYEALNQPNGGTAEYEIHTRNTNSKFALGSIQGGTVGYGTVTVLTDSLGTNGKTVSTFSNVADEGTAESKIFPYPSTNPREHRRGLLMTQTDYRGDGTKIKEMENIYDFPFIASISGVKAGFSTVTDNMTCLDTYGYCGITYAISLLSTEQVNKIKTIERNYDPTGVYAVVTTSMNKYENPNYTAVTKNITTEGKSKTITVGTEEVDDRTIETTFKYPYDFTTAPYTNMVTKNIIAPVIEKTAKLRVLDNAGTPTYTTLSEEKTTYSTFQTNLYLPQKIETRLYGSLGTWITPVEFLNYDSRGNLTKYYQRNGQTTNLSYYGTSDYGKTDLVSAITVGGGTTGTVLARSMNYDYKPLVGLSTSSDVNAYLTKYAHDEFNRLKSVKDHNDYLLKDFRYHYFNEANPTGIGVSANANMNFVLSRMARTEQTGTDLSDNPNLSSTQLQYIDGLGRDLQTILWQGSPDKTKDILASTTAYNAFGQAYKGILSTPSNAALGVYKSNAQSLAKAFYDNDNNPFTETIFEPSPLNRPQKVFGAGQAWRTANKFTEISYRVAGREVIQFDLQTDGSVKYDSLYQPSSLYNQVTISERGFWTIELKDRQGRVTHKFQQLKEGFIFAITAYVYDDLGRLRMVIPPEMYEKIKTLRADSQQVSKSFTEADEIFKEGMYGYHYDKIGRQIEKHIPGGGWRYSVFDKNDREVMFADEADKANGYWQFRKFDALSRIVQMGILHGKGSTDRATLQTAFDGINGQTYETTGTDLFGYTNASFPTGYVPVEADVMEVKYYDNHVWQTETAYNFKRNFAFHDEGLAKGLLTGMLSRNLETNEWLKTVNYFDYKGRLIQSWFKNHKGNIERSETQYRFNGEVLKMSIDHEGIYEIYDYQIDHMGRKTSFKHTLNGVLKNVSKYQHDDIGRLKTKNLSPSNSIGSVASGSWNSTNTWQNSNIPSINDYIRINAGHIVTINSGEAGSAGSLFNAGTLNTYGSLNLGVLPPSTAGSSDLQTIDFSYHIRGGLRGINLDASGNLTNKLFSMRLGYEDANFFDGNIGKQEWKSSLDNVTRSFTYDYDGGSRITSGLYSGGGNENYSLGNMSYDANGNILTLSRKGKIGANTWGDIDQLSYVYESNSNKIKKVSDAILLSNPNVGDFRDSSNVTTEYEYWQDGSLKIDRNKKISQVDYNHLKLPRQITFEGGQWIRNQYDATGKKLKSTTSDGIVYDFLGNVMYKNDVLYQISHDEGRIVNGTYEYHIKDHLGNLRVSFRDSSGIAKIVNKLDYDPWGLTLKGLDYSNPIFNKNNFQFGSKEKVETFGLNWIDFGARQYMPDIPHFTTIDPMSEKTYNISPNVYTLNNPINMIDIGGEFAVSVHYDITYNSLISMGYSKERADLIAHMSSTYADHPTGGVRFADHLGHNLGARAHLAYREFINYDKTAASQEESNSMWHSMMSDDEAMNGMSRDQAMLRGLKFGWDNIFAQEQKEDLGKLGQGLHALQDAYAHRGMRTAAHLDFTKISAWKQTFVSDMYGDTKDASLITKSAIVVLDILKGNKANVKDGDTLNFTGMSSAQFDKVIQGLLKQGFVGTIRNDQ